MKIYTLLILGMLSCFSGGCSTDAGSSATGHENNSTPSALRSVAKPANIPAETMNGAENTATSREKGPENKPTNSNDLFTVIVDKQSGHYAAVSGDGHVIALKDKSRKPIWTNDIIAKFGTKLPQYSNEKIESLELIQGLIRIYVGNMGICIDPQSGKITRMDVR